MQKLISVIIPAYNAENFITETINSVIQQSYSNWELIVIDDGSKDNTINIVQRYVQNESRIKVLNQVNSGVSIARNRGLEESRGDYVCFLDADDIMEKDNLETKFKIIEQNGWDAVYSACELIDHQGKSLKKELKGSLVSDLKDILELKGNYITAPSGFIYKKIIFDTVGGYDPNLSNNADQDLFARILHGNFKIGYIPFSLWKYRIHPSNMSGNINLLERDSIYMFKKFRQLNFFQTKKYEKKCFAELYYMLGGSWWKNGKDKMRALHFFVLSFLNNPSILLNKLFKK